ncbi:hypothetical protein L5M38_08835 [Shewanella sp. SM101]|uniref:DapH/DapD/GlmU-related protein n=1 Tax=Shewanella sp. SM101 TaxID=2912789 RepID=UPI0021D90869|nr:DapH/DapD/GlmU-related protein [Shewanella sp. SM101]MCU8104646.1 hypothetical protein [Shewanella sp. SM101]
MIRFVKIFNELYALLLGQFLLFPKLNLNLLRVYGKVFIFGNKSNLTIGKKCKFYDSVTIKLSDNYIYNEIVLGDEVLLETGVYLNAHNGTINLESNVFVGVRSIIQGKGGVSIGQWSMLGPNVQLYSSDHVVKTFTVPYSKQGEVASEIIIGKNVWLCSNVVCLRGVNVPDNSVISVGNVLKRAK